MSGRKSRVASKAERNFVIHHLSRLATENPTKWAFDASDLLSLAEAGPTRAWDNITAQVLEREQQDEFEKYIASWLWFYWESKNTSPEFEPLWSFWDSRWSPTNHPGKPAEVPSSPRLSVRSARVAPSEQIDAGSVRLDLFLSVLFVVVGWSTVVMWFYGVDAFRFQISDRNWQLLFYADGIIDVVAGAIGLLAPKLITRSFNVNKSTFSPLFYLLLAIAGTGLLVHHGHPPVAFAVAMFKLYFAAVLVYKWIGENANTLALLVAGPKLRIYFADFPYLHYSID
eukprot:TRINITY_DN8256_c0_g1_i1.p1 TRINITY_DN8256_c0_g1~~TRINITY_DN8256_c0_g1_i1.p1  ORF type:complete len:284 (+),score=22.12 TRINITY_DN8256_c0_g1_i1:156-1007(+)